MICRYGSDSCGCPPDDAPFQRVEPSCPPWGIHGAEEVRPRGGASRVDAETVIELSKRINDLTDKLAQCKSDYAALRYERDALRISNETAQRNNRASRTLNEELRNRILELEENRKPLSIASDIFAYRNALQWFEEEGKK